jgi:hypothetical protein
MSVRSWLIVGTILFLAAAICLAIVLDVGNFRKACLATPGADRISYESAMELSGRAAGALKSRDFPVASDMLDMAIAKLGNSYQIGLTSDDTGMVILAAKDAVARSDFELAAQMKKNALDTRLIMFRKKARIGRGCYSLSKRFSQERPSRVVVAGVYSQPMTPE